MLRHLTWNIRHGGGTRKNSIIEYVSKLPDIAILTDFRCNKNGKWIEEECRKLGYQIYHSVTNQNQNSVAFITKLAVRVEYQSTIGTDNHRIIKVHFNKLSFIACYFPNHMLKKRIFNYLEDQLQMIELTT